MSAFTNIAQRITHDRVTTREHRPGYTFAQQMGALLWLPMLLMGLMVVGAGFGTGIAQGAIGADLFETFDAGDKADFETLRILSSGLVLLGVAFLLAGISFALARIAGIFRTGGGDVQEAAGSEVRTLAMPWTAWTFLMLMMMGLMTVIAAFIVHVIAAVEVHDAWTGATSLSQPGNTSDLGDANTLTTWAGPVARFGVATLFTGIVFMLATLIRILRFQAVRIKELAQQRQSAA